MTTRKLQRTAPALLPQKQKVCPRCRAMFDRSKRVWIEWAGCKSNLCPECELPLFYRRIRGKVDEVVPLEHKVTVDRMVAILNSHLAERSGFEFDLGEATSRERKFAYEMIPWARRFMSDAEMDLGLSLYTFLEELLAFILKDEWWNEHLTSLLQIRNTRQRLAWDFYEHRAHELGISTPHSQRTHRRLQELINGFNESPAVSSSTQAPVATSGAYAD